MSENNAGGGRRLAVYAVGESRREDGKSSWTRIGIGFRNSDGSINLLLHAFPIGTSKLQVREEFPHDSSGDRAGDKTDDRGSVAKRAPARTEEARP